MWRSRVWEVARRHESVAGVTDPSPGGSAVPVGQPVEHFGERGICAVALRQERLSHRPPNGERRIVPGDAELACRIVDISGLVLDLRDRTDDAESVGEAG